MDEFIFDAWKVEMTLQRGEIVHRYFFRTVTGQTWVAAIAGSQYIGRRIFYDIDWPFYKSYGDHFNPEEIQTLRSRKAVHGWLDHMSHYGDAHNRIFIKVKITEEHLNGSVDEVLHSNFHTHGSFEQFPIRISKGCFTYLVSGLKSEEWARFLKEFKVKPGYTIFFYYCELRNCGTVIFNGRKQLTPYDRKNRLPTESLKKELVDSDASASTDTDADYEDDEEEKSKSESDKESEEELDSDMQFDEVIAGDLDLYSSDDSYSPSLRQMDAAAQKMDWARSPSPHGSSDVSSDPDSPKSL